MPRPRIFPGRSFTAKFGDNLLTVGGVYDFDYLPKTRRRLHYYDVNPLMLFFEFHPKYKLALGANLHFLTLDDRVDLIQAVRDRKLALEREWKWEVLYRLPEFRKVPIAFRQYDIRRIREMATIYNPDFDNDVDRDDLKINKRIIGNWTVKDTIAISNLARRQDDWRMYIGEKYEK